MRGAHEFVAVVLTVCLSSIGLVLSHVEHRDLFTPIADAAAAIAHPQAAQAPPPPTPRAVSRIPIVPVTSATILPKAIAPDVEDVGVADGVSPEEARAIAMRIAMKVPPKLIPYFDLYLYVSKAEQGPWAQHLYVFDRESDNSLSYEDNWRVSTGREVHERYFTSTPAGLFELDPDRFQPMHISHAWHGARMPWSMFLNYQVHDHMAGVALHAAVGAEEDAQLGHRASGGCVRLPLQRADSLYHRIQAEEEGQVPVFAFDEVRGTTSVDGTVEQDDAGNDVLTDGYRVLLVIDAYPGDTGPALVSQNQPNPQIGQGRLLASKINSQTVPDRDKASCFG
jgi:hypothetical protein